MVSSCLDDKLIAEYMGGVLSKRKKIQVENHIALCDTCLDQMLAIHSVLKDQSLNDWEKVSLSSEKSHCFLKSLNLPEKKQSFSWLVQKKQKQLIIQSYMDVFFQWAKSILFPKSFSPQPVQIFRGLDDHPEKNYIQFNQSFDDLMAYITIYNKGNHSVDIVVAVKKENLIAQNVRLTLMNEQGGIVSQLLKEKNSINDRPFGIYTLRLDQFGKEKGQFKFEINEDGINEQ